MPRLLAFDAGWLDFGRFYFRYGNHFSRSNRDPGTDVVPAVSLGRTDPVGAANLGSRFLKAAAADRSFLTTGGTGRMRLGAGLVVFGIIEIATPLVHVPHHVPDAVRASAGEKFIDGRSRTDGLVTQHQGGSGSGSVPLRQTGRPTERAFRHPREPPSPIPLR